MTVVYREYLGSSVYFLLCCRDVVALITPIGKDNGSFLVLLDLSAAFDTIDHDNLFYILEKYVGIGTTVNSGIF